ncbi:MAG: hypothetical protein A2X49_06335 [Lentisphaerae bacterium GWF2_52_8]|nr:MAG: hypothetical protein A2X49_06335 [Lentisphaerae bacterium GWF2_52_8]
MAKEPDKNKEAESLENEAENDTAEENDGGNDALMQNSGGGNSFLRRLLDTNFIEYASYVIKERAIPDVDDGFKPVQRRILWSLFQMDDGKFHKVANIIGHTMQYHPHGDASIGDALVVLANKEYFIDKQGNFGNILTGDCASAARYIECRLTPLAREVLFNNDITEFTDSYDGRNKEPIRLPVKIPSLLMSGADGIAVGMSTHVLPHNLVELLQAQIAILKGESFQLYPDFLQGGTVDVSEYNDGDGKVRIRARIERDGRKLIIRDIPYSTTTESLIESIEKAANRNKIKIASINDYTAEQVEIEVTPMRGYEPEKALKALYAYTDCSVSVSINGMVICENKPVQMSVSEIIRRNTDKLLEYLKHELEIELGKLQDKFHEKTLAQIFIENRIYKRIEKCSTYDKVLAEVREGLEKFRDQFIREVTDADIEKLLAIPIRRISLFDMNKNKQDLDDIVAQMELVQKHLKRLKAYAIKYLQELIEKYGKFYPRRTKIETFDKIDRSAVALNNIKVGWDRKNCYIGTAVKSDDQVTCNEYDHLLCVARKGDYRIINIPEKLFVDRLYEFRKYDKDTEFGVLYSENKSGKLYGKRCLIDKFITDKEYRICPEGCRLELITPRTDSIYECNVDARIKAQRIFELNLKELPLRTAKARGIMVSGKKLENVRFLRYLAETEASPANGTVVEAEAEVLRAIEEEASVPAETPAPPAASERKGKRGKKASKNIEDLPGLPAPQEEEEKQKSIQRKTAKVPPKGKGKGKSSPKGGKYVPSESGEDDWGISQPELGF